MAKKMPYGKVYNPCSQYTVLLPSE